MPLLPMIVSSMAVVGNDTKDMQPTIFAFDATGPEVDDNWLNDVSENLSSKIMLKEKLSESWELIRISEMGFELPDTSGRGMALPNPLPVELQRWDSKQVKPDSIKIVLAQEFTVQKGLALVIHMPYK